MCQAVRGLSPAQAAFRPTPGWWNNLKNLECIVLAKYSGVSKIRASIEGLSSEEMLARTWKPKEAAPPIATPHVGGTLRYRVEFLRACQPLLEKTEAQLGDLDPEGVVFPRFLCGQIERIKTAQGFPVD